MLGEQDVAVEHADRGEQLLERISAPPGRAWLFGAHAYMAVARVRRDTGDRERAEATVAPVLGAAERSGWSDGLSGVALLGAPS
jgi:hypothetical protein